MRGNDAESINRFFRDHSPRGGFSGSAARQGEGRRNQRRISPQVVEDVCRVAFRGLGFPGRARVYDPGRAYHVSISGRFLGASAPLGDHSPRGARRSAGMGGGAAVGGGRRTGGRHRPEAGPRRQRGRRDLLRCWGGEAADRSSLRGSLAANGPIMAGAVASLTAAEAIFQPGSAAQKRASDLGASLDSALFCGFSKGPCTDSRHEICSAPAGWRRRCWPDRLPLPGTPL